MLSTLNKLYGNGLNIIKRIYKEVKSVNKFVYDMLNDVNDDTNKILKIVEEMRVLSMSKYKPLTNAEINWVSSGLFITQGVTDYEKGTIWLLLDFTNRSYVNKPRLFAMECSKDVFDNIDTNKYAKMKNDNAINISINELDNFIEDLRNHANGMWRKDIAYISYVMLRYERKNKH